MLNSIPGSNIQIPGLYDRCRLIIKLKPECFLITNALGTTASPGLLLILPATRVEGYFIQKYKYLQGRYYGFTVNNVN
jgi:hypothetical protein